VDVEFDAPVSARATVSPSLEDLRAAALEGDAASWEAYGSALFSWHPGAVDEAIAAYRKAIEIDSGDAAAHFRLGVALRHRYDTSGARAEDFQAAVDQWARALDINPNNYIYRRRIQQYGPRLDKPYPFYDWVDQARTEIEARGERPVELVAEPAGAEIARPARSFEPSTLTAVRPDPEGKILRDDGKLVEIETTVVPAAIEPGATTRVHVVFRPADAGDVHWNNEADGLAVWLDPPEGWSVDHTLMTVANPGEPASREPRRVEFELRSPDGSGAGPATVSAYGLYYVCETARGACLYRRQAFDIPVHVR
jgi:hypothetical protein